MISPSGLNISQTIRIESAEQLSEVLIDANISGTPVLPIGGGTCLSTGNVVEHDYMAADLGGISGIVDYVPTDMTAGFLAGTPMSEVRRVLAENGQELPVDLALDDAGTIGGLVATGFSGPRRYGQGTLKDLVIGCEYVRGDGLVAKAGGMTVKNVSGFEIGRMLHGSWGSLAVLTRINLKVIPKPRADRTLIWRDADVSAAIERQMRLLAEFPGALALLTVQSEDGWDTAIRVTGRDSAVDDYQRQAVALEGEPIAIEHESDIWIATNSSVDRPQLVVSGTVEELRASVANLAVVEAVSGLSWSFGSGTVRADLSASTFTDDAIASNLWMIEGGSDSWRRGLPIWGPSRPDHAVMQSIKQQFDPVNILNRDRLFI